MPGLSSDTLLALLTAAGDDATRDAAVERLVEVAQPRVAAIAARYRAILEPEVLDDVRSTVMLRIVGRLRNVAAGEPIGSFDGFVATLTFNSINDVLRERAPARTQLKDRVRHLLSRSPRLASWHADGGIAAGFVEWEGTAARQIALPPSIPHGDLETAMIALFEANGAPLLVDSVVDAIAASWKIAEVVHVPIDNIEEEMASAGADAEARDELRVLWQEIRALRVSQRQALLLNLRDSNAASAIELFVFLGIATIDDVAETLEMRAEALAEIWNGLPLDDNAIAVRLGITRQQVINLRRAARERLTRKLHNTK
jgi:RNA polymerase sigma factor (sigma-70 family)